MPPPQRHMLHERYRQSASSSSSRYTQRGVLSTGVHGTQWPSSSSANTHLQAVVSNMAPNSWLLYTLQQRRQDHVFCHKVAGKFMACELESMTYLEANGTNQIQLHLGICLPKLRIITKTHRMTDTLAEIVTNNVIKLDISNRTDNLMFMGPCIIFIVE